MAAKIIALIQARMGSTRLPGKVALELKGSTVLEQVFNRVSSSKLINEAILVTTLHKSDLPLVCLCANKNIRVFCGSEEDVLDRFYQAAKIIKPDHIVRITADCPLMDPEVIDIVVKKHLDSNSDYTSNVLVESYPDGLDVEVFTYNALEQAWKDADKKSDREHVTLFMRNNADRFKLCSVENNINLSSLRWTLDEPEDYDFIQKLYDFFDKKSLFGMNEVLSVMEKHPSLGKINNKITRNEGLLTSLNKDRRI